MAHFPCSPHVSASTLCRLAAATLLALSLAATAQAPATQQAPPAQPGTQAQQDQQQPQPNSSGAIPHESAEPQAVVTASVAPNGAKLPVTLEILRQRLVGKQFFLRGGWLGDSLNCNEHGIPTNSPKTGSFTLSLVQITSVDWSSHHVEIEATRYALHFLGNLPYETTAHEVERVSLSSKRPMRITIDRARVQKISKAARAAQAAASGAAAEKPKPITNLSQVAQILNDALERIFAPELDNTMLSQLPEFWQLYYQSQRTGQRFDPHNANVFPASAVDQQAKVLTSIAPQSNEYAQANNIVGAALYRVIIGADGVPKRIAAERPIGFGLDENAVASIQKSTFQPAMKNGQPVAELVDLSVIFRIYSDRANSSSASGLSIQGAAATGAPAPAPAAVKAALPGPFAVQQPQPAQPDAAPATDSNTPSATPQTTEPQPPTQASPQAPPHP
ncbi:MAG TPA: energy transducer TonB [Acidobacteriaceae bacterium]|nr:energy transducer TonB [Acidobacteriaceae bacterium]